MKLLLLDQFSDLGGAQQVLLELLPAIRQRGWCATVALPGNGKLRDAVRDSGFAVERIDFGPRLGTRIGALAKSANADLVYLNGPRLLPAAAMAGLNCRVVFHSHSRVRLTAARTVAAMALRWMHARVIANCKFVAAQWRPIVPAGRIAMIMNGVAGPPNLPRRPLSCPPCIGCVGRISPEKGQREFVAAAAIINASLPGCRFAICGDPLFGNPKALRYAAQVRQSTLGLPIEFRGWQTDVYALLAELDILLVPSLGPEATTRVIPEAFAAGVPVIAFDTGGIPEVVEHGLTGMLVRSAEEMARLAVSLLTSDRERLFSMAAAARRAWEQRFTLAKFQQSVLQTLETVSGLQPLPNARQDRPPSGES
ncbi:MAG TPA: glycosyltransferase family 4 protein [Bryobacteraceae bacterium]|nr:glycosyltransferase family 4 protein [Bryobacteraceae bacterium]